MVEPYKCFPVVFSTALRGPSHRVPSEDFLRHRPAHHLRAGDRRQRVESGGANQAQYARNGLHLHEG